jgi:hypothetical protein
VLELMTVEDLAEVILCAHSYGGMVAAGAAARPGTDRRARLSGCLRLGEWPVMVGACGRTLPQARNRACTPLRTDRTTAGRT